jgi:hypothetical protein
MQPDTCRRHAGLKRLQTDRCPALGRIDTRLSGGQSTLLRWPRAQDASLWKP